MCCIDGFFEDFQEHRFYCKSSTMGLEEEPSDIRKAHLGIRRNCRFLRDAVQRIRVLRYTPRR
jgi:hypothetical protein